MAHGEGRGGEETKIMVDKQEGTGREEEGDAGGREEVVLL